MGLVDEKTGQTQEYKPVILFACQIKGLLQLHCVDPANQLGLAFTSKLIQGWQVFELTLNAVLGTSEQLQLFELHWQLLLAVTQFHPAAQMQVVGLEGEIPFAKFEQLIQTLFIGIEVLLQIHANVIEFHTVLTGHKHRLYPSITPRVPSPQRIQVEPLKYWFGIVPLELWQTHWEYEEFQTVLLEHKQEVAELGLIPKFVGVSEHKAHINPNLKYVPGIVQMHCCIEILHVSGDLQMQEDVVWLNDVAPGILVHEPQPSEFPKSNNANELLQVHW